MDQAFASRAARPSALLDSRVIYCGLRRAPFGSEPLFEPEPQSRRQLQPQLRSVLTRYALLLSFAISKPTAPKNYMTAMRFMAQLFLNARDLLTDACVLYNAKS